MPELRKLERHRGTDAAPGGQQRVFGGCDVAKFSGSNVTMLFTGHDDDCLSANPVTATDIKLNLINGFSSSIFGLGSMRYPNSYRFGPS